jgi:hypothetical protein
MEREQSESLFCEFCDFCVPLNTRDTRDPPEINNQRDFTDETVAMRSAILFVRSEQFVFKKRISNMLCSYANLAMNFQKAIPLFLVV